MKNDVSDPARFPVEVAGHLGAAHNIYSAEISARVNAALAERGQLITAFGGKHVRVPLAFAKHINAVLDDLLMRSPDVARLVRSARVRPTNTVRYGR